MGPAIGSQSVATNANFHEDLLHLRQNWRLKRTGKTIVGDLSYRSTGSRFWQSGVFEVRKADDEEMVSFLESRRDGKFLDSRGAMHFLHDNDVTE